MNSERVLIREVASWIGVAAILAAYIGSNFDYLSPTSSAYQLLNLLGAVAVGYDAFSQKNYQPVLLNIVWALVALYMLSKFILQ